MSAARPEVVVLDVVETLFSLAPVEAAAAGLGVALDTFFARLLRDGVALSLAGTPRPFREVATGALAVLAPDAGDYEREAVLDAFAELPAHLDVAPALERLAGEGIRLACLSNGSTSSTEGLLAQAGLDRFVERVLSVDDAGAWKPDARPYRDACEALDVSPARCALVAVHAWDVHGARAAGLTTGWAARLEGTFAPSFDRPDVEGADLLAVVEGLLALPV